jgi:mono/diheme cytochrome c family protein
MRVMIFAFCCWAAQSVFAQMGTASGTSPLAWDADVKENTTTNGETSVPFVFGVTNVSKEEVVITGTQASCQCTVASLPSTPWVLGPGSNGQINVAVNVAGKIGTVTKNVTIYLSNYPPQNLTVKAEIPPPPPMSDEERVKNQELAKSNAQAIFKGTCADCHLTPSRGRTGAYLYETLCGVCHEAGQRQASMVPNLHSLPKPTDYEFWKKTIANGKTNSLMPAFSVERGGPLSEAQINSLAEYLARSISRNFAKPVNLNSFATSNGVPIPKPAPALAPSPIRGVPNANGLNKPPVKPVSKTPLSVPPTLRKNDDVEVITQPAPQSSGSATK